VRRGKWDLEVAPSTSNAHPIGPVVIRIFIGYGYNDRDRWIEAYVFPLAEAFGCEVVHGKIAYGGALVPEVVDLIRGCDAMIGFTTRRDAAGPNQFTTHPWVVQELVTAHSQVPSIPFVEVREQGVIPPGGLLDAINAQRIEYRESDRAACLLQTAQALRRLIEKSRIVTVRLGPAAVADEIGASLDDPGFRAVYETLRGDTQLPPVPVSVRPIRGSLFVKLRGLAEGDLVRIKVSTQGQSWTSDFESVDVVDIQLR
jgi:hypothetical protein